MSRSDVEKWDRIYRDREDKTSQAARVLADNLYLLPPTGKALDIACGHGANAVLLAKQGLQVHAWDISQEALNILNQTAVREKLELITEQRDITLHPPAADSYDVIIVSRFLDRTITDTLIRSLRQGGLLYYQTFIKDKQDEFGPKNPAYRLDTNELLRLFAALKIIFYREDGTVGDVSKGFRNEAMLIGQKN